MPWRLQSAVRKAQTIDEVLKQADFVTLHVPLLAATRGLIDAKRLAMMKPGAVLLNFARCDRRRSRSRRGDYAPTDQGVSTDDRYTSGVPA